MGRDLVKPQINYITLKKIRFPKMIYEINSWVIKMAQWAKVPMTKSDGLSCNLWYPRGTRES